MVVPTVKDRRHMAADSMQQVSRDQTFGLGPVEKAETLISGQA
jgi:hypothetical protein